MGTAVVIGADRGIGAALVELYHGRGDDAVAVCVEDGNAWAERGVRAIGQIDVTNDAAVSKLAAALGDGPIDVRSRSGCSARGLARTSTPAGFRIAGAVYVARWRDTVSALFGSTPRDTPGRRWRFRRARAFDG